MAVAQGGGLHPRVVEADAVPGVGQQALAQRLFGGGVGVGPHVQVQRHDAVASGGRQRRVGQQAAVGHGVAAPRIGQRPLRHRVVCLGPHRVPHLDVHPRQAVAAILRQHRLLLLLVGGVGVALPPHAVAARHLLLGAVRRVEVHRDGGVVALAARVEQREGVGHRRVAGQGRGPVDGEGRVVDAARPWPLHVALRHRVLVGRRGHQVGVQRQLPAEDVAVVDAVAVNHLDIPLAVERAADEAAECVVGVVEVAAQLHVARVDRQAVLVAGAVQDAVAVGIGDAAVGAVAPAVVPPHAGAVARGGGVALAPRALLLRVVGFAQVGLARDVGARQPSARALRDVAAAPRAAARLPLQQVGLLPVGAGDVDVYVADIRVLHVDAHIVDGVGGAYGVARREGVEGHPRAVRAAAVALQPVGQEDALRMAQRRVRAVDHRRACVGIADGHQAQLRAAHVLLQVDAADALRRRAQARRQQPCQCRQRAPRTPSPFAPARAAGEGTGMPCMSFMCHNANEVHLHRRCIPDRKITHYFHSLQVRVAGRRAVAASHCIKIRRFNTWGPLRRALSRPVVPWRTKVSPFS